MKYKEIYANSEEISEKDIDYDWYCLCNLSNLFICLHNFLDASLETRNAKY